MRNEAIIAETGNLLAGLPEAKAQAVRDFAAFLAQQAWANLPVVDDNLSDTETEAEVAADEALLNRQTEHHLNTSETFAFLHDEPDIYTEADVKFRYDSPAG